MTNALTRLGPGDDLRSTARGDSTSSVGRGVNNPPGLADPTVGTGPASVVVVCGTLVLGAAGATVVDDAGLGAAVVGAAVDGGGRVVVGPAVVGGGAVVGGTVVVGAAVSGGDVAGGEVSGAAVGAGAAVVVGRGGAVGKMAWRGTPPAAPGPSWTVSNASTTRAPVPARIRAAVRRPLTSAAWHAVGPQPPRAIYTDGTSGGRGGGPSITTCLRGGPCSMSSAGRYRRRRRASLGATPADAVEVPLSSSVDPAAGPVPLSHPGLWRASVVVPTHNDGPNIAALLEIVLSEPSIGEVIVIASECRDQTVEAVREVAATAHGRVRLFVETTRSGKASAINFAVAVCRFDRVLIISGDVLPRAGAVEQLVDALDDPTVGLAGARPVPVDGDTDVMGVAVTVLWELHHRLALRRPKLGEAIAARMEAIEPLPRTAVDEATFQAVIEQAGWRSVYVPDAVVLNRGPRTAPDFIRQRRRTHGGHLRLRRTNHYTVPSLDPMLLLKEFCALLVADRRRIDRRWAAGIGAAVSLEVYARLLARVDELRRKDLHVWTIVESAKHPAAGPHRLGADSRELVAGAGVAAAAAGERDHQHELPLQLHVRDLQRVRAEGGGAQR